MDGETQCDRCGAREAPMSDNPNRHWLLSCNLRVQGSEETWSWTARARHDRRWRVLAWDDDLLGKPWKTIPGTHRDSPWILKRWMRSHVALNYPLVQEFLGHPLKSGSVAVSRRIAMRASSRPELLRVDPVRLKSSLHTVNVSAFRRKTRVLPGRLSE